MASSKNLFIITGDALKEDGFLALRLYCKTALRDGHTDIMFIMNYPAYYHPSKNPAGSYAFIDERAEEGSGFNYGYDHFIRNATKSHRTKSGDIDSGKCSNAVGFYTCLSNMKRCIVINENNQVREEATTNIQALLHR